MTERRSNTTRNIILGLLITLAAGFLAFVAKTQYEIASTLRDINSDNKIQWEMIKEMSQEMRNRRVDVEVTRTIQNRVILPTIFGKTNEAKLSQHMQKLEKKEELKKLDEPMQQSVGEIINQFEESKIYSKNALDGDIDHYKNAQKQMRKK